MEREHFTTQRDKDGDGRLSKAELGQWIMPESYDHAHAEAAHLMHEADVDNVRHNWSSLWGSSINSVNNNYQH